MSTPRDPLDELRQEISELKDRNARVEREKSWETSWTRRLVITTATWVAAWIWLLYLDVEHATLHALVPSAAYVISTSSWPIVRRLWMRGRS